MFTKKTALVFAAAVAAAATSPAQGTYQLFGGGCGANGAPRLINSGVPTIALGDEFSLDLWNARANAPAVLLFGFGPALDVPLDPIGMTGCTLYANPMFSFPTITNAVGRASVAPLPPPLAAVPLHGAEFANQYAVLDPTANRLGIAASNGGEGEIRLLPRLAITAIGQQAAGVGDLIVIRGRNFGDDPRDLWVSAWAGNALSGHMSVVRIQDQQLTVRLDTAWPGAQLGEVEVARGVGKRVRVPPAKRLSAPAGPTFVWQGIGLPGHKYRFGPFETLGDSQKSYARLETMTEIVALDLPPAQTGGYLTGTTVVLAVTVWYDLDDDGTADHCYVIKSNESSTESDTTPDELVAAFATQIRAAVEAADLPLAVSVRKSFLRSRIVIRHLDPKMKLVGGSGYVELGIPD